jgi:hypothetical protein
MYLEEKLDKLIDLMQSLEKKVDIFIPDLTTERGVMSLIGVSKETINSYYERAILVENIHFIFEGKKRVFFPEAIIKLKKEGIKGKRTQSRKQEQVNSLKEKLGIAA